MTAAQASTDHKLRLNANRQVQQLVEKAKETVGKYCCIVDQHYISTGQRLIVADYLLWLQKFKGVASPEIFEDATTSLGALITTPEPSQTQNTQS